MSAICNNCPGYAGCALNPDGVPCKRCRKELGYQPSNGDRLRDMTDDAMAQWLVDFAIASGWIHPNHKERVRMMLAAYQMLTQPAPEEE